MSELESEKLMRFVWTISQMTCPPTPHPTLYCKSATTSLCLRALQWSRHHIVRHLIIPSAAAEH